MTAKSRNVAASVRQRLLNLSRERGDDFQLVITQYALERFLYRLTISLHKDDFVLKGAMLFSLWTKETHRATRDLDLLGSGDPSPNRLEGVFRTICQVQADDDGLRFDETTVAVAHIREDKIYEGTRVLLQAHLGSARIPVQVDVGFGDATTPPPEMIEFPTLLDFAPPRLKAYPRETVVAEKFEAMVSLGMANSRMKDFYDLSVLASEFDFDGKTLKNAIQATFERRGTAFPDEDPLALTSEFYLDAGKQAQWRAFCRRGRLRRDAGSLETVVATLQDFLMPVVGAIRIGQQFERTWTGGRWFESAPNT